MGTLTSCEPRSTGARLRVAGVVQGVGFRPFVCRLARRMGVRGAVWNAGGDVIVEAVAEGSVLDRFVSALAAEAPAAAAIERIERFDGPLPAPGEGGFRIVAGSDGAGESLGVGPDLATCPACRAEMRDPAGRRFGYAFTTCTECGPRLSTLTGAPYDRPNTTMAEFAMCVACRREYEDLGDRRYHAQPLACPACGPALRLDRYAEGTSHSDAAEAVRLFWRLIDAGGTVAVKGIGGYHLACAATDPGAVRLLRQRKRRPDKPLAVMAGSLASLRRHCRVSPAEAALLDGPRAPIVLLRPHPAGSLAPEVAPGQHRIGAMLPYAPLHHLLFAERDDVLVMTSGNLAGRPQLIDDGVAGTVLPRVAEACLAHDRRISVRVDDSVVRLDGRTPTPLRLGRGYAPVRLPSPPGLAHGRVLAMGAQLKSTFCLKRDGALILSQHLGDLDDPANLDAFEAALAQYLGLWDVGPEVVAVDLHPQIASARIGRALAAARGISLVEVQHHHAHATACLAEHGVPLGHRPVLAIVLDGLGYGPDGVFWGCEILAVDYAGFRRLAHLRPVPMPGGTAAIREPWRMALSHLAACGSLDAARRWHHRLAFFRNRDAARDGVLLKAAAQGVNAPLTTSAGRLFDAVAALAGLREKVSYEGQAAAELEAALWRGRGGLPTLGGYRFAFDGRQMDPAPMWPELLQDLSDGRPAGAISWRFHIGLRDALAAAAERLRDEHGGLVERTVVLSGGVFQNAFLLRALRAKLARQGWRVLTHRTLPPNDGGLSAGQAAVAAAFANGSASACA